MPIAPPIRSQPRSSSHDKSHSGSGSLNLAHFAALLELTTGEHTVVEPMPDLVFVHIDADEDNLGLTVHNDRIPAFVERDTVLGCLELHSLSGTAAIHSASGSASPTDQPGSTLPGRRGGSPTGALATQHT